LIYQYSFITASTFVPAIEWHFFKLRAVPCDNEFQRVISSQLEISPLCRWQTGVDGQGNAIQWGSCQTSHDSFRVASQGSVEQTRPYLIHEVPAPYYLASTHLTTCTPEMLRWARQWHTAVEVMHAVHQHIHYQPCTTTTATTAAQVWAHPQGVCQDYAHLMLALCRAIGLPARYVNGFIQGEGQTHAWVEVSDGTVWHPYDPTHDLQPEWGYIKIAHGRDADDCPNNRGRFYSWTRETLTVSATLFTIHSSLFTKQCSKT